MSHHESETPRASERPRGDETDASSRTVRTAATLAKGVRERSGSIAALAGLGLLVRAARTSTRSESRSRTAVHGLAGAALLGVGIRRRSTDERESADGSLGEGTEIGWSDEPRNRKEVSDDASAARERRDVLGRDETNPRGVSADSDVHAADADENEGPIRFTADADEPRPKPRLDDDVPQDPRISDESDDVEIDLSEARLADEASEATGPAPEQSQPAQTEDTEPEPSPPEDASHVRADVPGGSGEDEDGGETIRDERGDR